MLLPFSVDRLRLLEVAVFLGVAYFFLHFSRINDDTSGLIVDAGTIELPEERRALIREAFRYGWEGYLTNAFPHDTLSPLSNTHTDDRSGWGATAVDALTAAILMEIPEAVGTSLNYIPRINWNIVSYEGMAIFGSTIRYMGAMLSAYDLLTTTHKHLVSEESTAKVEALLTQSQALADALSPSFGTVRGINSNFLNWTSGAVTWNGFNDITAISGLVLEWTRLSDMTGNREYADLVARSMEPILDPEPQHPSIYPGLYPKRLDLDTGVFNVNDTGGWSHAGGGLYEMFLKLSIYDLERFGSYRTKWIEAADSTMKNLASHPRHRPDLTFLADFQENVLLYQQDSSGMFAAASFILGGTVTGKKRFINFGLQLVNTYVEIYDATRTGIGPESIGWVPVTCDTGEETREEVCQVPDSFGDQEDSGFVERAGYYITNPNYLLRPEVLESLYYAYRATKDEAYRDLSWKIVNNIIKWCKAGSAFAELEDVNAKIKIGSSKGRRDWMSSYVLTEVFMYAYIIHLDDAPWQLRSDGNMEWIFSTQAHPLKVKKTQEQ
ncbi:glycoside hydrolase family 47 protein [Lophiotrema nucula]|uniref:alpha-1,2-Mannosidase n=1 Tax=Lophiotrema nucula TaxID=690887 RepID=A0A6A5YJ62_9PLEO|nr:glycoside hydrolase family 47 protein [Lophiotrema nucula]